MHITEYAIIGVLDAISRNRTGRLVPVLKYGQDNDPIRLGNVDDTFPERGGVVWFHVPPNVEPWTLWIFRVRESPTYSPSEARPDKYAVDGTPEQINDIIIGNFESADEARKALARGLQFPIALPRRPYVVVGADQLIGPLELHGAAGRYHLKPSPTDPQVDVKTLVTDKLVSISHAGHGWTFLFPPGEQGDLLGQLDWGDDTAVLRRAMRLLEKYNPSRLEDIQLTDKVFRRLSESVVGADLDMLGRSRIERALHILSSTIVSKEVAEQFQAEIVSLPSVRRMLESDREMARVAGKEDALREATEQMEKYRGELDALRTEVTMLQQEKSRLEKEIENVRNRQRNLADELDSEIQKRVEEAAATPAKVLADLILLRPFLRQLGGLGAGTKESSNATLVPSSRRGYNLIADEAALHQKVDAVARSAGFPIALIREIHASFLSGLVPCILGESALQLVKAYCSALFPESVLEVAINPGLLNPEQVLDHGNAQSLRSFLAKAQQTDIMHLVIFEGANRSLIDSSLLPLLRAAGKHTPFIQTFGAWPDNVLPLVTLSSSITALKVPDAFWEIVAVIDTNASESASAPPPKAVQMNNRTLSPAVLPLCLWQSSVVSHAVAAGKWRGWLEGKTVIRSQVLSNQADRFETSMRKLDADEVRIVGTTLACCFSPLMVRLDEKEKGAATAFPTFKEKLQMITRDLLEFIYVDER